METPKPNLEDLIKRCAAEVCLTVRGHRSYHQPIDEYINELGFADDKPELRSGELRARILAADLVYELRFYPSTPISFYDVYGTSLDEVVAQALNIMREEFPERF